MCIYIYIYIYIYREREREERERRVEQQSSRASIRTRWPGSAAQTRGSACLPRIL